MAFCIRCGQPLVDGAKFCATCGMSVTSGSGENEKKRETIYDGEIHKCPHCGEALKAFESVCPTCKFELRGVKGSSSVKELAEKIEKATTESQKISIIKNFPIPNTREDILEFMILAASNFDAAYYAAHLDEEDSSDAWLSMVEQCYQKAKVSFKEGKDFEKIEEIYRKLKKEKTKKIIHKTVVAIPTKNLGKIIAIISIIICLSILIGALNVSKKSSAALAEKEAILAAKEAMLTEQEEMLAEKQAMLAEGKIQVEYDSYDLEGEKYSDVIKKLNAVGFHNIEIVPKKDFGSTDFDYSNVVCSITIDGEADFNKKAYFNINAEIIIEYYDFSSHVQVNYEYKNLKGDNYQDVMQLFEDLGFINIKTETINDLITGWITKKGSVEKITIDGNEYSDGRYYNVESEVIIVYHTFK